MFTVDADVHAAARLLSKPVQNRVSRTAEHLNPYRSVKRFRVRFLCPLPHDRHVRFHRLGVRVELHYRHFVSSLVHEFVECDQPWLTGLDELDESLHATSFAFESARLEAIGSDEDEWRRHGCYSTTVRYEDTLVNHQSRSPSNPVRSSEGVGLGLADRCGDRVDLVVVEAERGGCEAMKLARSVSLSRIGSGTVQSWWTKSSANMSGPGIGVVVARRCHAFVIQSFQLVLLHLPSLDL